MQWRQDGWQVWPQAWRKLWRKAWRRLWFRWGLGCVLLILAVRSLPYLVPIRAADLKQEQAAIAFVDRNGLPLGTVLTQNQEQTIAVPLAQVSPHFLQAILAAEDARFYQHGAVDERAIVRAIWEAIQARQIMSGASTITMQLARMLEPTPRTLPGKLQEIWLAWRLAAGMSKDEILQAYVNRLPMGGNIYGVEAAARIYFGVPAQDLNLAQASLLAAIPNDPNRLNPYDAWAALKRRQAYVLDRLVQTGKLRRIQADKVQTEAVALHDRQQGIVAAPHFLFWLASQLQSHPAQVRTTIDRPLQQFAEAQVQAIVGSLRTNNVHQAAAVVLDNHTGEVLAYVGSPDYFATAGKNDGVQALRQPGSALKPFLYELALEQQRIRPNTVLADVPTRYAIPGAKLYTPADYSETFQGPVRVRVALANSLNVPAVRVLEQVGVPAFLDRLHELGFRHLTRSPEHYGLGLALGSGEVSLWELAQAYRQMARQGAAGDVRCGVGVVCGKTPGKAIVETAAGGRDRQATWMLITDMLSDAQARARSFGVESLLKLPFPAAVKTGTSSDFRDTWTVGFTADYTVAVWVGNFSGEAMRQISGITGAAPLWHRIMLRLHETREPQAFAAPVGMVQRPVCALSGAKPTPACPTIVQEYFYPEDLPDYERQPDPFYPVGAAKSTSEIGQPQLPAEYTEWLATQSPRQFPAQSTAKLKILSPREGDVFLLEPTRSGEAAQKVAFQLTATTTQPIEWRLNGQPLSQSQSAARSRFWQPQPGTWTLQVSQGTVRDQVRFEVQVAKNRTVRRGFSFGQ